jgi:cellulase/cellobiase CelA1
VCDWICNTEETKVGKCHCQDPCRFQDTKDGCLTTQCPDTGLACEWNDASFQCMCNDEATAGATASAVISVSLLLSLLVALLL